MRSEPVGQSSTTSPNALYLCHLATLVGGALLGVVAAWAIGDRSGNGLDLERARQLGIVSRTVLAGYAKSGDVRQYLAVILLPFSCSLVTWLLWSRGRLPALATLLCKEPDTPPPSSAVPPWVIAAITVGFLLLTFNINGFYQTDGGWWFLGEEGEYLAWVQMVLDGGVYGRDFLATRGPLVVYPLALFMKLFGVSVVVGRIYTYLLTLLSAGILALFLLRTVGNPAVLIASTLLTLVMFVGGVGRIDAGFLRVILALLPLLCLYAGSRPCRSRSIFAAGAWLAVSALYSQEAGLCALIASALFLLLEARGPGGARRLAPSLVVLTAGICLFLLPVAGYFHRAGALGALLDNLYGFPKLMTLGYAALPFPSLAAFFSSPVNGGAFLPYWTIGIYLAAAADNAVQLILSGRDRALHLRAALLVFGLLLFRVALGRSDESHFYFASLPAVLLCVLMVDDAVRGMAGSWRAAKIGKIFYVTVLSCSLFSLFACSRAPRGRLLMAVGALGDLAHPASRFTVEKGANAYPRVPRAGICLEPVLAEDLEKIGAAVERHSRAGDYVLFFPVEPAYYFLFNRRSPTRFVNAYFAVTSAQRWEMVADLERRRPEVVVYSLYDWRIDGIPEQVQVPEVVQYLSERYAPVETVGSVAILRRKGP